MMHKEQIFCSHAKQSYLEKGKTLNGDIPFVTGKYYIWDLFDYCGFLSPPHFFSGEDQANVL